MAAADAGGSLERRSPSSGRTRRAGLWRRLCCSAVANLAASILFWSSICSAISYLVAVPIAARIGLINTMVFTHLRSNILLILIPFAPDLTTAIGLLLGRLNTG
jgi:hypothetical protein